jgi:hypothetical protein
MNRFLLNRSLFSALAAVLISFCSFSQTPVPRQWMDVVQFALENDFPRTNVHSRNLYHFGVAMHDAWAAFEPGAGTYFLGQTVGGYTCPFNGIESPADVQAAQEIAISYALYRLMLIRHQLSPGIFAIYNALNLKMTELGYSTSVTSIDYSDGDPAKLGNFLAHHLIQYGFADGSYEQGNYSDQYYTPANQDLWLQEIFGPFNYEGFNPNRWQGTCVSFVTDANGYPFCSGSIIFGPEWGNVTPFALIPEDYSLEERDGHFYKLYHDRGAPALIDEANPGCADDFYKKGFSMLPVWMSHHTEQDGEMWDISPSAIGNLNWPENPADYDSFFHFFDGGAVADGHPVNPLTGEAYPEQIVPRGDFTRSLVNMASGYHTSANGEWEWRRGIGQIFGYYISFIDHPDLTYQWGGAGQELSETEFLVKSFFALGGTLHDAAIAAYSHKGWYDFLRPISAIRWMAHHGQCTDPNLPNYDPRGLPLIPGFIELIQPGDDLAGTNSEFVGEVKMFTAVDLSETDCYTIPDSVGWLRASDWVSVLRSHVSPSINGGYLSDEVALLSAFGIFMENLTGSSFFPSGEMELFFSGEENAYNTWLSLVNCYQENAPQPSADLIIRFATYRDLAQYYGLGLLWQGAYHPHDVVQGYHLGDITGQQSFNFLSGIFNSIAPEVVSHAFSHPVINDNAVGENFVVTMTFNKEMNPEYAPEVVFIGGETEETLSLSEVIWTSDFVCELHYLISDADTEQTLDGISATGAQDNDGAAQYVYTNQNQGFLIDTRNPQITVASVSATLINDAAAGPESFAVTVSFDEPIDSEAFPTLVFEGGDPQGTFTFNQQASAWLSSDSLQWVFDVADLEIEIEPLQLIIDGASDANGNVQVPFAMEQSIQIDTKNPHVVSVVASPDYIDAPEMFLPVIVTVEFDEPMASSVSPGLLFTSDSWSIPEVDAMLNPITEEWISPTVLVRTYEPFWEWYPLYTINVIVSDAQDVNGNPVVQSEEIHIITVDNYGSVPENDFSGLLIIFPNPIPAGSQLLVSFPENQQPHTFTLTDMTGRMVFSTAINPGAKPPLAIQLPVLAGGMYVAEILSENGRLQGRLVVGN